MALPRNSTPIFQTKLPSTGKAVKYRPWLVGEQKNLMMALGGDNAEILLVLKEAIAACTFEKLDVDTMPDFDLEYLFLQIRAKSVGESIDLVLTCQHCKEPHDYKLDISDVKVQHQEGHSTKVRLSDKMGVEMSYPTTEQFEFLKKNYSVAAVFQTICECIRAVYTEDEVHSTKDEPMEEIAGFLDSLTPEQLQLIEDFFRTMPVLKHTFADKCPHCEKESIFVLEGIEAFFG